MSVTLLRDLARPWPSPIVQRIVPLAIPDNGTDFVYTVPGDKLWLPLALRGHIALSGVANVRQPVLRVTDSTNVVYDYPGATQLFQNTGVDISWIIGLTTITLDVNQFVAAQQLPEITLQPGWTIGPVTSNLDVNDQWDGVTMTVLEIFSGAIEHERQNENAIRDHLDALGALTAQAGL